MTMFSEIRILDIVNSWDFKVAFGLWILSIFVPENALIIRDIKDIVEIVISFDSILFSVFFSASTIFIAFPSSRFISFCNVNKKLETIFALMAWTLGSLFSSLIYSIFLRFGINLYSSIVSSDVPLNQVVFSVFIFLTFYSLFCTIQSAFGSFTLMRQYIQFISVTEPFKEGQ